MNCCLKNAMTKVQEGAAKLSESEQQVLLGRADVITYTALSEIENFNRSRVVDFKGYLQKYVGGQIEFYKQVRTGLVVWCLFLAYSALELCEQYAVTRLCFRAEIRCCCIHVFMLCMYLNYDESYSKFQCIYLRFCMLAVSFILEMMSLRGHT